MSFVRDFNKGLSYWFLDFYWLATQACKGDVRVSPGQRLPATFISFNQYELVKARQHHSMDTYLLGWLADCSVYEQPMLVKPLPAHLGFKAGISKHQPVFKQTIIAALVPELYPDLETAEAAYNLMEIGDV